MSALRRQHWSDWPLLETASTVEPEDAVKNTSAVLTNQQEKVLDSFPDLLFPDITTRSLKMFGVATLNTLAHHLRSGLGLCKRGIGGISWQFSGRVAFDFLQARGS